MDNAEIGRILEEMADLLEIQEANPFRVRAYRNAARTVRGHATPMSKLLEEGADLTELPGIGKEMESHIRELVSSGLLAQLEELADDIPRSLVELMRLPGVGAKKARKLWQELGIETVDELESAARSEKVAELEGFGETSQRKILQGIEEFRRHQARFKLSEADRLVEDLLAYMGEAAGLERIAVAGSYRRRMETVGDIDLLSIANDPEPLMQHFTSYPRLERVVMAGDTRGTIVLSSGLQVDLRILPAESYGAALVYFTGSKDHNIKLRRRAQERDLRLSEYGVFKVERQGAGVDDEEATGDLVAGREEKDVYATVDLPWIPPELREDRGEIEAAARGELPRLIELDDLRGDLQMHTTWSDGQDSVEEMLAACVERHYQYCAITDHSKALAMTGGLDAAKLREQWKEMSEVADRHSGIRLLRSIEVDILVDGSLDLEDEILAELDLVVVSLHSRLELPAGQQTKRILTALEHPHAHILAHPTARLINRREPIDFDLDQVLQCAKENGVAVELNANPDRLDLKDTHLMLAKRLGVKVVISTDAHRTRDLDLMRYGVEQARRAWLTTHDVLNTRPLDGLLEALGKGA